MQLQMVQIMKLGLDTIIKQLMIRTYKTSLADFLYEQREIR